MSNASDAAAAKALQEATKAIEALRDAVVSFHRDWRFELKRQRGECTCPWNQNPLEPKRGHHRQCASLKGEYSVDDACAQKDLTMEYFDEEL